MNREEILYFLEYTVRARVARICESQQIRKYIKKSLEDKNKHLEEIREKIFKDNVSRGIKIAELEESIESKQLTIAELREQYNRECWDTGLGYSWQTWLKCARANKLLKE